jgi:replicative DNA helicase
MAQQQKNRASKNEAIPTDGYLIAMIRTLLANMCGDFDRTYELSEPITIDHLPEDLVFERDILRLYLHFSAANITPTRENLIMGLRTIVGRQDFDLEKQVDTLLQARTVDGLVYEMSHFIFQAAHAKTVRAAIEEAHKLVMAHSGNLDENLDTAIQKLISVARDDESSEQRNMSELFEHYEEILARRKLARMGGLQFPSLKYKGFVGEYDEEGREIKSGAIPVLEWGQTALITALPGTGKTTIGGDLAEYNSWTLGHDSLYIHLETEQWDMMDRSIARNCIIPTDYLTTSVDYDDKKHPVTKMIAGYKNWIDNVEMKQYNGIAPLRSSGEIIYKYCPGWTVHKINALIKVMRRRSHNRGRGLLVFIDYYNLIDQSEFSKNRAEALGQIAMRLRDNIKIENMKASKDGAGSIYLIIFAQENRDEAGNAYAYGSKEIIQYVQVYLSLERTEATSDAPYMEKGAPVRNTLGHTRYWHRAGDYDSNTTIKIMKGNRTGRGSVNIRIEGEYFRVEG